MKHSGPVEQGAGEYPYHILHFGEYRSYQKGGNPRKCFELHDERASLVVPGVQSFLPPRHSVRRYAILELTFEQSALQGHQLETGD